jgi:hypothetical protein
MILAVALFCFMHLPVIIAPALIEIETISLNKGSATLDEPYEIQETMMYKDGGTIGSIARAF